MSDIIQKSRRNFIQMAAIAATVPTIPGLTQAKSAIEIAGAEREYRFLQGPYTPVVKETTAYSLKVDGRIPPELSGRYLRNGHNPKPGVNPPFWFAGSGMIHGVRIARGKAEWYRNRWVRTPALDGAPLINADGSFDLLASAAATSVYAHAGRILALQEVNLPYQISPDLRTIGPFDFGGKLKSLMTAHPKVDKATGELVFFSSLPYPPFLIYHVADAKGDLVRSEVVDGLDTPTLMHDFAVTRNYVLWFDGSVAFDSASNLPFPYLWSTKSARVGVMKRNEVGAKVKWIEVPPFFMFHIANAYENESGQILLDSPCANDDAWNYTIRYINAIPGSGKDPVNGIRQTRWTIDVALGIAKMEVVDDLSIDFPTFNTARLGVPNRYTYAVAFPGRGGLTKAALVRYDSSTGGKQVREFPTGTLPNEPWFVQAENARSEDDGWIFTYVSRTDGKGQLMILNASKIDSRPVAVIEIPARIPAGIHGSWVADSEISI